MMASLNSLVWLVTNKCNLSCSHCYARRFTGRRELSTIEALALVDEADVAGVRHLSLVGGEPLLRDDIFDIIQRARSRDMSVSLVTNGMSITPPVARRIASSGVHVTVSVDGARPGTHDQRRGAGSYHKAILGISHLTEAAIDFRMILALGHDNFGEAEEYVELSRELGAVSACFIPVMPSGRATEDIVSHPSEILQALKDVAASTERTGQPVQLWCLPFAPLIADHFKNSVSYCRGSRSMDIDPSGNVLLCDVLDEVLSSVRDNRLEAAWKDQCRSSVIQQIDRQPLSSICADCHLSSDCRGGCFAQAQLMTGSLFAPDPLCPKVANSWSEDR